MKNRRHFLKLTLAGLVLGGCRGGEKRNTDQCLAEEQLGEGDRAARKAVNYSAKSEFEDVQCDNCQFWLPSTEERPCGGCVILKGIIAAEGYCSSWAPIIS